MSIASTDSLLKAVPPQACDTHMHFYDKRYPTARTAIKKTPANFTPEHYQQIQRALGIARLVVVQPTTYGLDNRYQLAAASAFGTSARVIIAVDETVTESQLMAYHTAGVRGVRFFMRPGGPLEWTSLRPVAERIAPLGWHVELHLDGLSLPDHVTELIQLPCPVSLDHIGRFSRPVPLNHPATNALSRLLDSGRCWVKLSAPHIQSESGPPLFDDVRKRVDWLACQYPERLVWATNLPHPGQDLPPDDAAALTMWLDWLGDAELIARIFSENAATLYDFTDGNNNQRGS